ncbi:MAG: ABC transporter ATP-binding protein, partial [Leclercia adecarboxylata]|nr:ABC transporter ATP-binding protein [Leclercia adecarboxylata]
MNVTRKQERLLRRALTEWQQEGALTPDEHQRLASSLKRVTLDWQRLSRYAFWTAIACVIIAIGSLFADSELMARIIEFFAFSTFARIGLPALVAVLFYLWGFSRQRRETQWHYSTEAILFLGVFFTAIALWQLGERLDTGSGHIAPLFLLGCAVYGLVGFFGRSGLVWLFFLLSLGNWFGAETGYMSGWGAYWLGMSYPVRFIFFGGALLALCWWLRGMLRKRHLYTTSKAMGLTYLFIAHDLSMVRHISTRIGVMYLGKLVEVAPSDTLYQHPAHPYTRALLASVPQPDPRIRNLEQSTLRGEIPGPTSVLPGCKF